MKFPWSRRSEIDEEMRTHLQMAIRDRVERGESPADAERNARREFGNETIIGETTRDMWGWVRVEEWGRNLHYVFRQLRQNLAFAVVAILTLALGLGATTAVFSIVDSVLLEPLKYPAPDRLFSVVNVPPPGVANRYWLINPRHFYEWREHCRSCEDVAAAEEFGLTMTGVGEPERFPGMRVSYNFFRTLGVRPALGRDFRRDEELPGQFHVLILSDLLWRSRFAGDPGVIGRTIQINGEPHVVVGVMAPDFQLPEGKQWGGGSGSSVQPLMFRPLGQDVSQTQGAGNNNLITVVRLKPGIREAETISEFNALISDFIREFHIELRPRLLPLRETVVHEASTGLWLLLSTVGIVLVIVCANVGNLMLVRTESRYREVAIRMALGSSRAQLFLLVLTEAVVLVAIGSAAGLVVASAALKAFVRWAPAGLPRIAEIHMGTRALIFAIALSAVSTSICGLLPAWRLAGTGPQASLKVRSTLATTDGRRLRFRELMVSVEVALSVVLLIIGGLLMTSFFRLTQVPKGFEMEHLVTQDLALSNAQYDDTKRAQLIDLALTQLRDIPGVRSVAVTNQAPLRGEAWLCDFRDMGNPEKEASSVANFRFVSPGYWQTLGIPLEAGRVIDATDKNRHVAVLSEGAAQALWPGQNPIGKRVGSCGGELAQEGLEVVGVVGNVRAGIEKEAPLTVYQPYWTTALARPVFMIRTPSDPAAVIPSIRKVIRSIDADLPLSRAITMDQIVDEGMASRRFQLNLATAFAAAALFMAALSIYGVISFTVARRTPELGIRVALGAGTSQLGALVVREGMIPVLKGIAIGLLCTLPLGRFISSQLYGVSPYDPWIFFSVTVLLLASALGACWIPARRAMRIDPLSALRLE